MLLIGAGLLSTELGLAASAGGMNDSVIGLVMAAYFAGFIIAAKICPYWINRVGHIRAYAVFAAIGSVAALLHGFSIDPWLWAFLRLIVGISLSGLYMVVESWLNALTPNDIRGRVFSIYIVLTLLASSFGQLLVPLFPIGHLSVFALISIFFTISLVPVTLTRSLEPKLIPSSVKLTFAELYRLSPVGTVGSLVAGLICGSFWAMGAVYCARVGMDVQATSSFMFAVILGGVLLQWPIGRWSDGTDRRKVMLICMGVTLLLSLLALLLPSPTHPFLLLLAFCYGGVLLVLYSLAVALINDVATDVLAVSSRVLLLYGIGAVVGPILTGALIGVLGAAGYWVQVLIVLVPCCYFIVYRMRKVELPETSEEDRFTVVQRTSSVALKVLQEQRNE